MGRSEQIYEEKVLKKSDGNGDQQDQWLIVEGGINGVCDSESNESSFEDSMDSIVSSSSSDMVEDATSSTSSSSSSPSYGPLYELSELIAQLPIKRGLSKYYQGKSQTFASLESVKSLEDLAKKGRSKRRKIKSSKSYGGGLDNQMYSARGTISKKKSSSRVSLLSSSLRRSRGALFSSCRASIPVQKNL